MTQNRCFPGLVPDYHRPLTENGPLNLDDIGKPEMTLGSKSISVVLCYLNLALSS